MRWPSQVAAQAMTGQQHGQITGPEHQRPQGHQSACFLSKGWIDGCQGLEGAEGGGPPLCQGCPSGQDMGQGGPVQSEYRP